MRFFKVPTMSSLGWDVRIEDQDVSDTRSVTLRTRLAAAFVAQGGSLERGWTGRRRRRTISLSISVRRLILLAAREVPVASVQTPSASAAPAHPHPHQGPPQPPRPREREMSESQTSDDTFSETPERRLDHWTGRISVTLMVLRNIL